jgi:hypothetical protein
MTDPRTGDDAGDREATAGSSPRWLRSPQFVSRRVADEMLLIPIGSRASRPQHRAGDLCALNATGEFLWGLLESPQGVDDLVRNLIDYFDVAHERAREDVEKFVADLRALEAITPVEGMK